MNENISSGAIKINWLHRLFHRYFKRISLVGDIGVDWNVGSPYRNIIGQVLIKNQGQNDSCSGQAGSYLLQILRLVFKNVTSMENLSAKSIYAPIAYPQGGTTVSSLMTQISAHGANLEATVPSYDAYGNPLSESMMEDRSWETDALREDAENRAGYTPVDVPKDIDSVAQAIAQHGAVIWEIQGQNNGTWTSAFPNPPSKNNPNPLWQHFMCAYDYGIINGQKYIFALQSMGNSWGVNGVQYFNEDYFNSGHIIDVFTFIPDQELAPNSNNYSIWSALVLYFKVKFGFI